MRHTLPPQLFIGIDGGGSSTRAIAFNAKGTPLSRSKTSGCNPNNIGFSQAAKHISEALRKLGLLIDDKASLCLGVAGLASDDTANQLRFCLMEILPQLPSIQLRLTHDLEISYSAAFKDKPGILLIAGTGSACYARDSGGQSHRISGRSYAHEDPGSGYAIGRRAIDEQLLESAPTASRAETAALAKDVLKLAGQGNEKAKQILQVEAQHLAQLVNPLLQNEQATNLALAGGMLTSNTTFRVIVEQEILHLKPSTTFQNLTVSPETGAARLAWSSVHQTTTHCPF